MSGEWRTRLLGDHGSSPDRRPWTGRCRLVEGSAWTYGAYEGGGYGEWQQEPSGDLLGDSFQACDIRSDGYAGYVRIDMGRDSGFDSSGHHNPCGGTASPDRKVSS